MINPHQIRSQLRSKKWTIEPFRLLSAISNICAANADLGREFVIRALENREELDEDYQNILDELVMQAGL